MTYLDKAKKLLPRFIQLMEEKGKFYQYEPCTEQEVEQIEQFLDLLLPADFPLNASTDYFLRLLIARS